MSDTFDLASAQLVAAGLPTFKPTQKQEKYIRDGLAYLVVKAPFFAHLFYNETRLLYSTAIPYAATDAKSIFVNPEAMEAEGWGLYEIAFVMAHEIGHVIFGDLLMSVRWRKDRYVWVGPRKIPYIHQIMNMAEDYRINAMLVEAKIGKMPSLGLYDPSLSAKGMESAVEIYAILWDRLPPKVKKILEKIANGEPIDMPGGVPGAGQGEGGFDIHLEPSQVAVKEEGTGRREQAIAAAGEAARSSGQGTMPAAIQQLLGEILEPKVPWQDHLKSTMQRASGDPTYDWRYIDKRCLVAPEPTCLPRQSHTGAGCIVVASDNSGSVADPKIQQVFFSEMAGICADLNPSQLVAIWCDAAIQKVADLDEPEDLEDLRAETNAGGGVTGGGGTDFRPVFEKVEEMGLQPDMLVYITDSYGTFPNVEPDYPVIWACIIENPKVPWGTVIHVEID